MTKRLWDKGEELNRIIHSFTVGNDPLIDLALVRWDAIASAAHAKLLKVCGILKQDECAALLRELQEIVHDADQGRFEIPPALEDCHTAIEARLSQKLGDAGKKIHTGRSRNDQVLVATRLLAKNQLVESLSCIIKVVEVALARCEVIGALPLPGYTHFQKAMPASVGMWLGAIAESLLQNIREGLGLLSNIDANPLGVGSGFGVPLNLDRKRGARLMGFARVQRNPISVQNSRGQTELKCCRWFADVGAVIEKCACDLMLFTSEEFGFFSLPVEMTTGSSIMPQKRNPDVVELLRASAAKLRSRVDELQWLTAKLPSNYHRDFQYTKEPFVFAAELLSNMLVVFQEILEKVVPQPERLAAAMSVELYSTYDAYREVRSGVPFRDAYQNAAKRLKAGQVDKQALSNDFSHIECDMVAERKEAQAELIGFKKEIQSYRDVLKLVALDIFNDSKL